MIMFSGRGGQGPKKIYKGHKEIAKKASNRFEKTSIPLKTYCKSLNSSQKVFKSY
jgi:hypothetical protein